MSRYCEHHETWDACAEEREVLTQRNAYVGQAATLCYPSDRYPLKVTKRTPKSIELEEVRLPGQHDTVEMKGPWPVKDASSQEDDLPGIDDGGRTVRAHWSEAKRGWYVAGSTPVRVGTAHYRRDWSE